MTDRQPLFSKRPYVVVAFVGMVVIVAGNVLTTVGGSFEVQTWGHGIRQVGLTICVFTGVAFLLTRNAGKWKQTLATRWRPTDLSSLAISPSPYSTGPSPLLITFIRIYCALLILAGIYTMGLLFMQMLWQGFSPYRMGWAWWYLLYSAVSGLLTVAPGFLIWGLTNAIVRMSRELDSVSRRTAQLEIRLRHAGDTSVGADRE